MPGDDEQERRDAILKMVFSYRDGLVAFAFGSLRDWTLAEDVVQDAFLVVMDKWRDFQEGTNGFAWVRQIVQYKILESYRRRRHEVLPDEDELVSLVNFTLAEQFTEEREHQAQRMRSAMQACMKNIDRESLEILNGFYAESRTCEVLATERQRSPNAIRLVLSRLRKELRVCIQFRLKALPV